MKKVLLAFAALVVIGTQILASTNMCIKLKDGKIERFNEEDVEEIFFENTDEVIDEKDSPFQFYIESGSAIAYSYSFTSSSDVNVVVPDRIKIDGVVYNVTGIESGTFCNYNSKIESITIPSSIISISKDSTFLGLSCLAKFIVALDNPNFSSIDDVLYSKDQTEIIAVPCKKAGEFTIPSTVKAIADFAFADCISLTDITIPVGVEKIGYRSFQHCTGLSSILIPSSVTDMSYAVFRGCPDLVVTVDNSQDALESYSFTGEWGEPGPKSVIYLK